MKTAAISLDLKTMFWEKWRSIQTPGRWKIGVSLCTKLRKNMFLISKYSFEINKPSFSSSFFSKHIHGGLKIFIWCNNCHYMVQQLSYLILLFQFGRLFCEEVCWPDNPVGMGKISRIFCVRKVHIFPSNRFLIPGSVYFFLFKNKLMQKSILLMQLRL
jgi:hypothetical protein